MTWGPGLLDEKHMKAQAAEQAVGLNPWGPGLGLPADAAVEAEPAVVSDEVIITEQGMSIATVEQRLGEDPTWWPAALELEITRSQPRKGALRAILSTAAAEEGDPAVIEKGRAFLDSL